MPEGVSYALSRRAPATGLGSGIGVVARGWRTHGDKSGHHHERRQHEHEAGAPPTAKRPPRKPRNEDLAQLETRPDLGAAQCRVE